MEGRWEIPIVLHSDCLLVVIVYHFCDPSIDLPHVDLSPIQGHFRLLDVSYHLEELRVSVLHHYFKVLINILRFDGLQGNPHILLFTGLQGQRGPLDLDSV